MNRMVKTLGWMLGVVGALAWPLTAGAGEGATPGGWRIGIGTSLLGDAGAAGAEAAEAARKQFGTGQAKVVLVFAVKPQVTPELIAGVAKHFPKELIYGGEMVAPLTPATNLPDAKDLDSQEGVGVLALGGDIDLTIVADSTATPVTAPADAEEGSANYAYLMAGRRLGEALKGPMAACPRPGKLVLTFGDQFNGSNRSLAIGFQEALGGPQLMVGGANGNQTAMEIVAGEIKTRMNVAMLFCGDFTVGMSMKGGTHTPETADRVLGEAWEQGKGAEPFFGFVFNCRRRRNGMIERNQLGEELAVFRKRFGATPFFGGYGPGEIGVRTPGSAAEGTGFSVSAALLFPAK